MKFSQFPERSYSLCYANDKSVEDALAMLASPLNSLNGVIAYATRS